MARGRPSTVIVDSAELAAFNDELDDLAESSQRTTAGDIHRLDSRTDENDSSSASSDGPSLGTIRTAAAAGLDEYVTNLKRQCRLGVEAESRLDTFVQVLPFVSRANVMLTCELDNRARPQHPHYHIGCMVS